MRINNNLMAMNTHRQLNVTNNMGAKSMEKLSSGFRINRAGDDAAGLSISEKMRGQIRGLNQASRNAQDSISLIQTAEGALTESHSILQRMRELAVQSANDTNVDIDRGALQSEVNELAQELTRIADNTEFNTQNLLNGDFSDKVFHIGANEGQDVNLTIGAMDADSLNVQGVQYQSVEVDNIDVARTTDTARTITVEASTTGGNDAVETTTAAIATDGNITVTLAQAAGTTGNPGDITATEADVKAALESIAAEAGLVVTEGESFDAATTAAAVTAVTTNVTDVDADASKLIGIDISSQEAASSAITTINTALEDVSSQRSDLGAMQNRLEYTIRNLDTSAENLQASESRIRDVDMAAEMMEFTKQNILQQAAQAMLAQANQAPQGVLQLLR